MVALLRIAFIALAFAFGMGLTAAAALGVLDLLQVPTGVAQELADAPPPFSFSSYAYTPVIAAVVLLSGFAALRRRWEALAVACWFLFGAGLLEALFVLGSLGWSGLIPGSIPDAAGTVLAVYPMLGLLLVRMAKPTTAPLPDSTQESIRLRNTLVGLAVVSTLWRAVTIAASPGVTSAIAYLRGTSDVYVVLSSVIGLGTAVLLVVCILASFKGNERVLHATLALAAGLAFEGFLGTLDSSFGFETIETLAYSLQDAVAFLACGAALALSVRVGSSPSHAQAAQGEHQT